MVELSKLLGTKYIYGDFAEALRNTLEKTTEPIDLVDCKFTPQTEDILRRYYHKREFCNSGSSELNAILKHNQSVVRETSVDTTVLQCNILSNQDLINIIRDIDKTRTYVLPELGTKGHQQSLMLMIILSLKYGDEMKFELGSNTSRVFAYIRNNWLYCAEHHDTYWEEEENSIWKREVQAGRVYIPGKGYVREKYYVDNYNVIPYCFGIQKLWNDPEFIEVQSKAVSALTSPVRVKAFGIASVLGISNESGVK